MTLGSVGVISMYDFPSSPFFVVTVICELVLSVPALIASCRFVWMAAITLLALSV